MLSKTTSNKVLDNAWFVSLLLITVPLVTNLSDLVKVFGLHERLSALALFAAVVLNGVASVLAATFRVIFRKSIMLNTVQVTAFIVSCLMVVSAAGATLYYYVTSSNAYISLMLYVFSIVVLLALKPKGKD